MSKAPSSKDNLLPGNGPYIRANNEAIRILDLILENKDVFIEMKTEDLVEIVSSMIKGRYLTLIPKLSEGIREIIRKNRASYLQQIGELTEEIDQLERKVEAYRKLNNSLEAELSKVSKKDDLDILFENPKNDYKVWKESYDRYKDTPHKTFSMRAVDIGDRKAVLELTLVENEAETMEETFLRTFLSLYEILEDATKRGDYLLFNFVYPFCKAYWEGFKYKDPTLLSKLLKDF